MSDHNAVRDILAGWRAVDAEKTDKHSELARDIVDVMVARYEASSGRHERKRDLRIRVVRD